MSNLTTRRGTPLPVPIVPSADTSEIDAELTTARAELSDLEVAASTLAERRQAAHDKFLLSGNRRDRDSLSDEAARLPVMIAAQRLYITDLTYRRATSEVDHYTSLLADYAPAAEAARARHEEALDTEVIPLDHLVKVAVVNRQRAQLLMSTSSQERLQRLAEVERASRR